MKKIQVSAIFMLLVLLFAAVGKEATAQQICTDPINISDCTNAKCLGECQRKHGPEATGVCPNTIRCLCSYPC
ncbi:S locus-related glycoprotein 1 binding pollen coat [Corchorus olitorius]|uniref:S locus-related glycoprotein 1 binding pollen coat n=1 Tax=Corchorus olitorius TaxID=93759 RepID=A0A1R3L4Q3_9ROSI|nr:S locus-related glycoprotein 1 binding pollen coat [Corchorus olitorius]